MSPSPRPPLAHKPYSMFNSENEFVLLPVKKDLHLKVPPLEAFDARIPSDSQSERNFQSPSSHSYIDFKPPPKFSQQDVALGSSSLSREYAERTTPPQESDYHVLLSRLNSDTKSVRHADHESKKSWDRRDTKTELTSPRVPQSCLHFQCVSKEEHERELRLKLKENEEQWERKRSQLLASLEKRMQEFESKVKLEYEQRTESKDQRAARTDTEEIETQAKGLSDELLRKHFEEQLAEESEKSVQQEKEIVRLERLLALKSTDESELVADLRNEIDHLSRELDEKVTKMLDLTEVMAEKEGQIEHLTARLKKCAKIESENAALSAELSDLKSRDSLHEALKLSLQELEQENYILKKDYEELLSIHKKVTQKDAPSSDEIQFKACSPLKRRFNSVEIGMVIGFEGQESIEARRRYEDKCIELKDELEIWKAKARTLESQYCEHIEDLRKDNQQLKTDVQNFLDQSSQQMQEVLVFFEQHIAESSRQD